MRGISVLVLVLPAVISSTPPAAVAQQQQQQQLPVPAPQRTAPRAVAPSGVAQPAAPDFHTAEKFEPPAMTFDPCKRQPQPEHCKKDDSR